MFNPIEKNEIYLNNKIFVGLVEENKDDKRKGRIKVRVQGVFNDIELDHIPWASPFRSLDAKSFSVPAIGKIVNVIFPQGNLYEPQYIYSENYNINLQNKLNDLSDDEYINFVSLLLDHRSQIYVDDTNLRLDYYFNQISLHENGINIHLKDNSQELHLGHDYAEQSAVLGDHWLEWFDKFMQTLLTPTSLVGNFGAPILKPQIDQLIQEYQAIRPTFLSKHVKIVDNGDCKDIGKDRKDTPTIDDFTKVNNDKILNSPDVSDNVKDKIKDNRNTENQKLENAKPAAEDIIDVNEGSANGGTGTDGIIYGDSTTPDLPITPIEPVDPSTLNLSENELNNIQKSEDIENRKNIPKSENKVEPISSGDPYSDFWSGGDNRRNADSFNKKPTTAPGYGSYVDEPNSKATTNSGEVASGGGTNVNQTTDKSGQKIRKTKKYGSIKNGEIPKDQLSKVDGFTIKGKKSNIYLEENAAKAFSNLNKLVLKEFNKSIDINGDKSHYRTFEQQNYLYIHSKPGFAAKPGSSNHGWGLACDITEFGGKIDFNTPLYKFLKEHAGKYNIVNPPWASKKPIEAWHWEYVGPNIYTET